MADLLPGEGTIADVIAGAARWCVITGDNADYRAMLPADASIISDPPYGMAWDHNTTRFSGGTSPLIRRRRGDGRCDRPDIIGDAEPFDPSPWLDFPRVVLFGANHFGARLPVGSMLVWIKKLDDGFGTFLSDAEIAWCKGGHGVYCHRDTSLMSDTRNRAHPTQKPIGLMVWAMTRAKVPAAGLVVDPYCGSGTTGVAALRTGRRFIGCEISPEYASVARRRCAEAAAQPRLFADVPEARPTQHALELPA